MTPTILTSRLPRLEKSTGIQITATIRPDLAPVYDEPALCRKIERLIDAGTSHFRLNLSHFKPDDEKARNKLTKDEYESRWRNLVRCIDSVKDALAVNVFIMIDTAGPEFRIDKGCEGDAPLQALCEGREYLLSGGGEVNDLREPVIYLTMPARFSSFGPNVVGREISFKDGDCTAEVVGRPNDKLLRIKALHGLDLSRGDNIKANFPSFDLQDIDAISPKDRSDLEFFLKIPRSPSAADADGGEFIPIHYIAQSFVREAGDIGDLNAIINTIQGIERISRPLYIPKIETAQAVAPEVLKKIASHPRTAALMVARGDLGSEFKRWMVPSKQREIIRVAHSYLKPVLVATEVYGSMGKHPDEAWQPNRGEVLDLRHALEAGVDGIVFSAETGARKKDPWTTVEFAVKQAKQDEKDIELLDLHKAERDRRRERMEFGYDSLLGHKPRTPPPTDELPLNTLADFSTMDWACAAVYRANIRSAAGIFPFTVSGNTVRDMVHFLPYRPIVALVDNPDTLPRLALFAHVHPVLVERVPDNFDVAELKELVEAVIDKFGMNTLGGEAFATMPHPIREASGTDTLVRILCPKNGGTYIHPGCH